MSAPTVSEATSKLAVEMLYSAMVSGEIGVFWYGRPLAFRPNGSPTPTPSTWMLL